jgi:hypothetical protein
MAAEEGIEEAAQSPRENSNTAPFETSVSKDSVPGSNIAA